MTPSWSTCQKQGVFDHPIFDGKDVSKAPNLGLISTLLLISIRGYRTPYAYNGPLPGLLIQFAYGPKYLSVEVQTQDYGGGGAGGGETWGGVKTPCFWHVLQLGVTRTSGHY